MNKCLKCLKANTMQVTSENAKEIIANLGDDYVVSNYWAERSPNGRFGVTITKNGVVTEYTGVNNVSGNFLSMIKKG